MVTIPVGNESLPLTPRNLTPKTNTLHITQPTKKVGTQLGHHVAANPLNPNATIKPSKQVTVAQVSNSRGGSAHEAERGRGRGALGRIFCPPEATLEAGIESRQARQPVVPTLGAPGNTVIGVMVPRSLVVGTAVMGAAENILVTWRVGG